MIDNQVIILNRNVKKIMKKIVSLIFILSLCCKAFAQQGYQITAKFTGVMGGDCKLVFYYGEQMFVNTTAFIDGSGTAVFQGDKPLERGLYLLAFPKKIIEILVSDEQHFSVEVDTANISGTIKFVGTEDNQVYYDYQRELRADQDEFRKIVKEKGLDQPNADKAELKEMANDFTKEQRKKIAKLARKHAKLLGVKLLKGYFEPELPSPKKKDGSIDSVALYMYHKEHFFENFDFDEIGLIRTPLLRQRLDMFFNGMVSPFTEPVTTESDILLAKVSNRIVRKYIISYLAKRFEILKTLGQDGIYPYLLEKYYLNEPTLWDSSTIASAQKVVDIQKPLIIGKVIPNLILTDSLGRPINLHELVSAYTVLFIFNPGCGHCKAEAPHLVEFYEKIKSKEPKITIMTAAIPSAEEDWIAFIRQYKMQALLNGRDAWGTVDFNRYNTYSYPTIYLLDKDKHILAKHIEVAQIEELIEATENIYKTKALKASENK